MSEDSIYKACTYLKNTLPPGKKTKETNWKTKGNSKNKKQKQKKNIKRNDKNK
jgi:hypothetical protein